MWPFKPNDWKIVYTDRQEFTGVEQHNGFFRGYAQRECAMIYVLKYSSLRNKFNIEIEGEIADNLRQSCPAYQRVLNKQIELQEKLMMKDTNEDPFETEYNIGRQLVTIFHTLKFEEWFKQNKK